MNPLNNLFDLTGKRALITGSTKGIGYTLAKGLAFAGAEVIINARHQSTVDDVQAQFTELGLTAHGLVFDVTDRQAVNMAINDFEAQVGVIDILVNNAGIQIRAPLEDFESDDFDRLMITNVNSVFYVSQTVARHMIKRGGGTIINIASVQSALARPTIAPYTASKGAVSNLTKGMTTDWAKYGLQINALAPGYFVTPLTEALVNDEQFSGWLCNRTPSNRWGELEELVGACIFLSSKASSFVNGQTIYVDGGITACI